MIIKKSKFTLIPTNKIEGIDNTIENDKYVFMNIKDRNDVFGESISKSNKQNLEGLIKISHNKSIYRTYLGVSNLFEPKEIAISVKSFYEIGISPKENEENPENVKVEKATWFGFLWHNSDSTIRIPFRFTFIGLLISFFSIVVNILLTIIL